MSMMVMSKSLYEGLTGIKNSNKAEILNNLEEDQILATWFYENLIVGGRVN